MTFPRASARARAKQIYSYKGVVILRDKKLIIFLAGKITGDKNYRKKFQKGVDLLEQNGFIVLNPAVLPDGMDNDDYEQICITMINVADAIFFLPDFDESQGAMLELSYANYIKKKIGWITKQNKLILPDFFDKRDLLAVYGAQKEKRRLLGNFRKK